MARRSDFGDGDPCPVHPEHGHMVMSKSGKGQYCPHQQHDRDRTPAFYEYDGRTPRRTR